MLESNTALPPNYPTPNKQQPNSLGSQYFVIKRNGERTSFDIDKISIALKKAFLAVETEQAINSTKIHQLVETISHQVYQALIRRLPENGIMHIEDIQDQVELGLMRAEEQKVARAYVLYRTERALERKSNDSKNNKKPSVKTAFVEIKLANGKPSKISHQRIKNQIALATLNIEDVSNEIIFNNTLKNTFKGMSSQDLSEIMILGAREMIDQEPNYSYVSARLLLANLAREAVGYDKNLGRKRAEF